MPESPKFLYVKKKYELARYAISKIAKFNGHNDYFIKRFDDEIVDLNLNISQAKNDLSNDTNIRS